MPPGMDRVQGLTWRPVSTIAHVQQVGRAVQGSGVFAAAHSDASETLTLIAGALQQALFLDCAIFAVAFQATLPSGWQPLASPLFPLLANKDGESILSTKTAKRPLVPNWRQPRPWRPKSSTTTFGCFLPCTGPARGFWQPRDRQHRAQCAQQPQPRVAVGAYRVCGGGRQALLVVAAPGGPGGVRAGGQERGAPWVLLGRAGEWLASASRGRGVLAVTAHMNMRLEALAHSEAIRMYSYM